MAPSVWPECTPGRCVPTLTVWVVPQSESCWGFSGTVNKSSVSRFWPSTQPAFVSSQGSYGSVQVSPSPPPPSLRTPLHALPSAPTRPASVVLSPVAASVGSVALRLDQMSQQASPSPRCFSVSTQHCTVVTPQQPELPEGKDLSPEHPTASRECSIGQAQGECAWNPASAGASAVREGQCVCACVCVR